MTRNDNPALKFELLQSDDFGQYLLRDRTGILHVLRNLIRKRAMVTAYLDSSQEFMLTSVLDIAGAEDTVVLDVPADPALRQRAEAAEELICITQADSVKIQFPLRQVHEGSHDGGPALLAPLPDRLLRLQRREYFRLTAPASHPLTCLIPVSVEGGPTITYESRVLDISGGGVAIVVPPEGVEFNPETEFADCMIELPDTGVVRARLRVRNLFRITGRSGVPMLRAGCEFMDLPERVSALIHRYILRVERERSARERGL